jgi:cysteine-rich repeat protein
VYASPENDPAKLFKLTNANNPFFDDPAATVAVNFHLWPTRFGRYHAMIMRPGTCAQNLVSPDYDKMHVLVIDLNQKVYSTCVDDSEDVWCGDALYEPNLGNVFDNLEICDDGNQVSLDGCTGDCLTVEPYWTCISSPMLKSNCTYVACGNGIFDGVSVPKGVTVAE